MEQKKTELQTVVENMLPPTVVVIGYMEHQLDLQGQLLLDIIEELGGELSPEMAERVNRMKQFMAFSSIDFENIENPLEAYKYPNALNLKQGTREIQRRYLNAQIREGFFGK